MTHTKPQQAEVLAHYQEIAAEYNSRANQTCELTYRRLVDRFMRGKPRLLELGGGSSDLLESLGSPIAVACDLSREMLLRRPQGDRSYRVVAVSEQLPFGDARFDGVFSINGACYRSREGAGGVGAGPGGRRPVVGLDT
jgi:ubiquinone/menaquinone biosynthesis C-methylase UbiE